MRTKKLSQDSSRGGSPIQSGSRPYGLSRRGFARRNVSTGETPVPRSGGPSCWFRWHGRLARAVYHAQHGRATSFEIVTNDAEHRGLCQSTSSTSSIRRVIRYDSLNHSPRSTRRQRSEQKGNVGSVVVTDFPQTRQECLRAGRPATCASSRWSLRFDEGSTIEFLQP